LSETIPVKLRKCQKRLNRNNAVVVFFDEKRRTHSYREGKPKWKLFSGVSVENGTNKTRLLTITFDIQNHCKTYERRLRNF